MFDALVAHAFGGRCSAREKKVEEMSCFPSKCAIVHSGEYCHLSNDNSALWIWGAVKCRVIRLHIFALSCYLLERKGRDGTKSVKVVSCVKLLTEWKKLFWCIHEMSGISIKISDLWVLQGVSHYLKWITLDLNTSFFCSKPSVQGLGLDEPYGCL